MPEIKYLLFSILFVSTLSIALVSAGEVKSGSQVTEVRGLFYLDGSPVAIRIVDGKIDAINRLKPGSLPEPQLYIGPGLIDNQVNGYASVSFVSDSLTVADMRKATQGLYEAGVTTYLPTLVTDTQERLVKSAAVLNQAMREPDLSRSIPGLHLEGPYISPVDGFRGAHKKEWVRPPNWAEFEELNRASGNKILQVSLAPEVEGGMDFVRKLVRNGIKVALAHHNATAEQIRAAIDEGAGIATHLGNGCANMIHRHDNPLWPQLADDRLLASVIVDGFHLRPEEVQVFLKVKGPDRLVLTSDVVDLAGMPPGEYHFGGQTVVLAPEGVVRLPAQNVLAGAASPLDRGVENVMRFTGCSLADAIHMASRNLARFYGFDDRGEIETGKRADLVLFSLLGGKLTIERTIVAGEVVYSRAN